MADGIAAFFQELGATLREGWQRAEQKAEQRRIWNAVQIRASGWDRELAALRQQYEALQTNHAASPFADAALADRLVIACLRETLEALDDELPPDAVIDAMASATLDLLGEEIFFGFPHIDWQVPLSLEEGMALKQYLERKERFLARPMDTLELWSRKLIAIWTGMLGYLPGGAVAGADDSPPYLTLSASVADLMYNLQEAVERLIVQLFDEDTSRAGLFTALRDRLDGNVCAVSGIPPEERATSKRPLVLPTNSKLDPAAVIDAYVHGTPFAPFFAAEVPFTLPQKTRFEHAHIVGGTGHGKTQLLQLLIRQDLNRVAVGDASVVVIDSQGDLIRTISRLDMFDPAMPGGLADRLVLIDPNDILFPAALNLFDTARPRYESYSPVEREKLLNATVELYEYMFGALLGAELTQKQGVIFRYLARLLLAIPDATVQTLRELMEDGTQFRPYMEGLPGTARHFFETEFFHPSFRATKQQILKRLWGVLSNPTFERMFSHPRNKVDLFELMNRGSVILISTAKDLLKQEGSSIFGRFFIAQIAQAATERAVLPPNQRTPTFVYVDEAADYLDHHVEHLVNQARKYAVGLTIAHQNLDQLSPAVRATVMASTSIKFGGGVSAKDARILSDDMRCDADLLQGMRKYRDRTEFAAWIKNVTPRALRVAVPIGSVEALPVLSEEEHRELLALNRRRYCVTASEVDGYLERIRPVSAPIPQSTAPSAVQQPEHLRKPAPPRPEGPPQGLDTTSQFNEPPPTRPRNRTETPGTAAPLGQGGREHVYLQQLIKQAAQQSGWRATIEQPVTDDARRVDVSLEREGVKIACEVSVTTSVDHEMANTEKCLAAGYGRVYLISSSERRLVALKKAASKRFLARDFEHLDFFLPEQLVVHLKKFDTGPVPTETVSRGYKVKLSHGPPDLKKGRERRNTVTGLIAQSIKRMKRDPSVSG